MLLSKLTNRQLEDRVWASKAACADLVAFARLTSPTAEKPWDVRESTFEVEKHHNKIASRLMDVEEGKIKRLIVAMPPRHGKTELAVRKFIPWYVGRHPEESIICGTYSDTFSADHGRSVRDCMLGPGYRQTFGKTSMLRTDSQAVDRLQTVAGGILAFVGRGGSITGRGGSIVLDDPIKDSEEASSQLIRDKLWQWFTETLMTRLMTDQGFVVIIQTRWHEDDLVGRLTDPRNPHYSAAEAAKWYVLRIPALAEALDPLGRQKGEALWPGRFSADYLLEMKNLNARSFQALWQGNPTPDEGTFFKREWIKVYQPADLPRELRIYAASDHAVGTKQVNDKTAIVIAGMDERQDLWILDVWWERKDSLDVSEAMLMLMRKWKPLLWFAEKGHISQSIGPFLRKRMHEEHVYCAIDEVVPIKDKQTRAQSFQGRTSMGKVHFPANTIWLADAIDELLKFPLGSHDDLVDALSHLGMGLDVIVGASTPKPWKDDRPKPGTLEWIRANAKDMRRLKQINESTKGF